MIEACSNVTGLGYDVFFSGSQATIELLHQDFWLMQMDLCLDIE